MARQTIAQPHLTQQIWAASAIAHWHLVPGGGILDPAADWPNPSDILELDNVPTRKVCMAGQLIGRTPNPDPAAPADDPSFMFRPWLTDDTYTEVYLVPFDVLDIVNNNGVELLVPAKTMQVYYNWLPQWNADPATIWTAEAQAKVRELYHCIKGGDITDGVEIGATVI